MRKETIESNTLTRGGYMTQDAMEKKVVGLVSDYARERSQKSVNAIKRELKKLKQQRDDAHTRWLEQLSHGTEAEASKYGKEYTACTQYCAQLENIIDCYEMANNNNLYFTKDSKQRIKKYVEE